MGSGSSKHKSSTNRRQEVQRGPENDSVPVTSDVQGTSNVAIPLQRNSKLSGKVQPEEDSLQSETNNASTKRVTFAEGVQRQQSELNIVTKNLAIDDQTRKLLSKYCEKTTEPSHVSTLTELADSVGVLATKVESICDLLSTESSNAAMSLRMVYSTRPARHLLSGLAVDLGVPKLIYEIVSSVKKCYPDLTKWDREKIGKEPMTEAAKNDNDAEIVQDNLNKAQYLISELMCSCLNFSDLNVDFCVACGECGLIVLLLNLVQELKDCIPDMVPYVDKNTQRLKTYTARGRMLSRALGVLHNCSRRMPNRTIFYNNNAINVLLPFLKAEVTLFATKSLFCLAYLIDESNNHLIMTDAEPIKFIIRALERALSSKIRRFLGFSPAELADGLIQISINDQNKKKIGECGAISVLAAMLESAEDDEENLNGANSLWMLAFDDSNRHVIKSNESCMTALHKLKDSDNKEIQKAAAGALWEIDGKRRHSANEDSTSNKGSADSCKHVMISYQWDVQSTMIQVKNKLQATGYKVWMDLEQMGGSTLEAMAKAVENSAVVLVCVSQKYKDSPNCRSEAEYAFSLHKDIIPLMLERHYRPDGWLGMIVGSKLWFEFSERHKVESSVEKLKKELGGRGKLGEDVVEPPIKAEFADEVDSSKPGIQHWTQEDVTKWLNSIGLSSVSNKVRELLDGRMLMRLLDLRSECQSCPDFFYSSIKSDFELTSVCQVLKFTDELEKLVG